MCTVLYVLWNEKNKKYMHIFYALFKKRIYRCLFCYIERLDDFHTSNTAQRARRFVRTRALDSLSRGRYTKRRFSKRNSLYMDAQQRRTYVQQSNARNRIFNWFPNDFQRFFFFTHMVGGSVTRHFVSITRGFFFVYRLSVFLINGFYTVLYIIMIDIFIIYKYIYRS